MQTTTLQATPSITLDVFAAAAPTDLRRRLREQPAMSAATLLPGGMILEETEDALTYRMTGNGEWRLAFDGETVCLTNGEGATVRIDGGKLSLAIAK
ncbi:hypothetical protein D3C72_959370 [compost metagenome]